MVCYQWTCYSGDLGTIIRSVSLSSTILCDNALSAFRGHSTQFAGWRAIYLTCGLITVFSVPFVYLIVDSDVTTARFLNEEERPKAVERLRANNTGTGTNQFKWRQVIEMFLDPKSHLFFAMTLLLNVGAAVTNAFGPTLIANFGFDSFVRSLSIT